MRRIFACFLMMLCLDGCARRETGYYRQHPEALQDALSACLQAKPPSANCSELEALSKRFRELAWELQSNPQGFGQRIMAIQSSLASPDGASAHANKDTLRAELEERLALEAWIISPGSKP